MKTCARSVKLRAFAAVTIAATLFLATALAQRAHGSGAAGAGDRHLDLAGARLIDLTHPFDERTLYWPTSPSSFELKILHRGPTDAGYHYEANSFCTPEHGGTHLDAPVHFAKDKLSVDQIALENLIAPAIVLDVRDRTRADPDYRASVADVEAWESRHGRIPEGAILVLHTGWSDRWPDRKRYLGDDRPGDASNLHFPSFGVEAARFLIEGRRVRALGVDTASIDYGQSRDFAVHRLAGAANVAGLENLTNLAELPPTGAWIAALPMKVTRGSGAPARVVAFVAH